MLISDSKLVALDTPCRKQLLFREERREREYTILFWTFRKKMLPSVLLGRTETKGLGGGWRKQEKIYTVDLLMI